MFNMKDRKNNIVIGVVFTLSLLVLFGAGCQTKWIGFYYPDPINLSVYERSPELPSLEECRKWIENQKFLRNAKEGEYDYECGSDCKYDEGWEAYICKDTIK